MTGNRRRSAETSHSQTISTPSPPRGALLTVSPPSTVRKSSSHSALPTTQAPRRPRVLHRRTSNSSVESDDLSGPLEARYGKEEDTDDEAILSALSLTSPKKEYGPGKGRSYAVRASAKSGRHSVAAGELNGPMTLRDQEKVSR